RRELTRPAPGATRAGLLPANRPAPTEVYTLSLHDALPIYLDQNRSVVRYNDFAREIVALFKYRGRERLARPLGRMMAEEACKMVPLPDWVTIVPLHPSRLKDRGFNQSELLARIVSA